MREGQKASLAKCFLVWNSILWRNISCRFLVKLFWMHSKRSLHSKIDYLTPPFPQYVVNMFCARLCRPPEGNIFKVQDVVNAEVDPFHQNLQPLERHRSLVMMKSTRSLVPRTAESCESWLSRLRKEPWTVSAPPLHAPVPLLYA